MNIFLSFLQSDKNYPVPAYDFWPYYLKNGIIEAGHQWCECAEADWALGLVPCGEDELLSWKADVWSKTVDYLKKNPADLFLSYLYPRMIDTGAIEEIKRLGIPCINFYCDHLRDFKQAPPEFSVFDLNWVPEYKATNLYQKAAYPYINLPMPIWVEPALRVLKAEKYPQVTFIGSRDVQRQRLLEKVLMKNPDLPLAVYGKGWLDNGNIPPLSGIDRSMIKKVHNQLNFLRRHGLSAYLRKMKHRRYNGPLTDTLKTKILPTVTFEEYNELTAESMVTLGINRYPSFHYSFFRPDTYSRLRDIEAPMLGACYLTEWTEGIDKLYRLGEEIEVYRDEEELVHKILELKRNREKRMSLKISGQKRALESHSIPSTLDSLLCALKS